MKVSVIVPNHGRDLRLLNASIDESLLNKHDSVEVLNINLGLERSKQRNIGIEQATGDALLFLDSDQSVSPKLIAECLSLILLGYNSIYIPEVIVAKSFFGRLRSFEREFYTGTSVDVPRFVLARYCPKFDESLSGPEDADWGNRIPGLRAISHNVLYHHDDIGFLEYCRKKAYYTKSMRKYSDKWPNDPVLDLKYRCFTVFTERGKWKKLIRHPIMAIGIVFLLITRGIIYYANR